MQLDSDVVIADVVIADVVIADVVIALYQQATSGSGTFYSARQRKTGAAPHGRGWVAAW